jgi:hypothetical protein
MCMLFEHWNRSIVILKTGSCTTVINMYISTWVSYQPFSDTVSSKLLSLCQLFLHKKLQLDNKNSDFASNFEPTTFGLDNDRRLQYQSTINLWGLRKLQTCKEHAPYVVVGGRKGGSDNLDAMVRWFQAMSPHKAFIVTSCLRSGHGTRCMHD